MDVSLRAPTWGPGAAVKSLSLLSYMTEQFHRNWEKQAGGREILAKNMIT